MIPLLRPCKRRVGASGLEYNSIILTACAAFKAAGYPVTWYAYACHHLSRPAALCRTVLYHGLIVAESLRCSWVLQKYSALDFTLAITCQSFTASSVMHPSDGQHTTPLPQSWAALGQLLAIMMMGIHQTIINNNTRYYYFFHYLRWWHMPIQHANSAVLATG